MFKPFLVKIKNRLPLLVLFAGSGGLLFSSVAAKTIMDGYSYGVFALFLTLVSVLNSFGLFGAEQAFLRVSRVEDRLVHVKKGDVFLLCFLGGVSTLAVLVFLSIKGFDVATFSCMALTGLLTIFNMFLYNFYRLNGLFVFSQAISNIWKLALALVILSSIVFDFENVLIFALASGAISMLVMNIVALFRLKSFIVIGEGWSGTGYVWGYLFSMGVLTIIANIDRFLIDLYFGVKEFGDYFYIISVFLSPFLVVASYVGFSSLGDYKRNFQLDALWKNLAGLLSLSVVGAVFYYFLIQAIVGFGWIESPFTYGAIVPVVVLAISVVRVCYSALSAAMGAVGELSYIYLSNWLSLAATAIGAALIIYGGVPVSIFLITLVVLLLWATRLCVYAWAIRRGYEAGVRN